MNLIVSRASRDYVLQMTGGRAPRNILFCARNGIAAMGFAGCAEIGGVPTDQWLAEAFPREADLGRALTTITRALSGAPIARESAFDLHVAGWQWSGRRSSGRRSRPVIAGISKDPGAVEFQIEYLPRYWFLDRGKPGIGGRRGYRFNVSAAPDRYLDRALLQRLVGRLRDLTPDDAESVLSGALRGIAETHREAGPHRLGILLQAPQVGRVRVRSATGAMGPWLVGPDGIAAPRDLSGTTEIHLGPYTVSLEGHPLG